MRSLRVSLMPSYLICVVVDIKKIEFKPEKLDGLAETHARDSVR